MPVSPVCVALYTQIQPLYLSAPLGGTKGKSMGLLWSGAKAVIKRYRRQSHTQLQEWKSSACTTLIFTPSVTHLSLCVRVCIPLTPSLFFFVCTHTPSFPSQNLLKHAYTYSRANAYVCRHITSLSYHGCL